MNNEKKPPVVLGATSNVNISIIDVLRAFVSLFIRF
jgi:hypothetical protein